MKKILKVKQRIFNIIQIGNREDFISRLFDYFIIFVIMINLTVTLLSTFDECAHLYGLFDVVELVTIIIFTIEYFLRLWTAEYLYPKKTKMAAVFTFVFSFYGIVDFLTCFPYYLPFVFPAGAVAFRIFRVVRILRLFKINNQYDAFNIIVDVINEKKDQILSSVVMVLILMVASSLSMYTLEHEAQPEQFKNAFSGIWWSVSTLLTVGYGDIYPVTIAGKVMAIFTAFLGVGMVAIPTGIISAGFVERYSKFSNMTWLSEEKNLKIFTSEVNERNPWIGQKVKDIVLPPQVIMIIIDREGEDIVPNSETVIQENDVIIFGALRYESEQELNLKEIIIKEENSWIGMAIRDLDISRQELIVMIRRRNKSIIPTGKTVIKKGDHIILFNKKRLT